MKITLIRPVNESFFFDPEIQEPLGIETLAGTLEAQGHSVQLLDAVLTGQTEKSIIRRAAAFRPDALGVSIMSGGELSSAERIMCGVQNYLPQIILVAGGNLVSTEPYHAVNHLPYGTLCIRYEGEVPWLQIVDAVEKGKSVYEVNSALFKNDAGEMVETQTCQPIDDLDTIPDAKRYFAGEVRRLNLAVNIQGSRGCIGSCKYCCSPGFPASSRGRRRDRSPGRIVDEIQLIVERENLRIFNFVDDDFFGVERQAKARADDFAAQVKQRGLLISFGIQARPYSMDRETVQKLAEAGLSYVFFGIETDAEADLRRWGRRQPNYDLGNLVKMLRENDIEPQAGCIPFHPHVNLGSYKRLTSWLMANRLLNYRTATNRIQALPGSEMYAEMKNEGKIAPDSIGPVLPDFIDPGMNSFYKELLAVLDPMRAVWVYAACKVPVNKAMARIGRQEDIEKFTCLKSIVNSLDEQTGRTLAQLIERYERAEVNEENLEKLRVATFSKAMDLNRQLFRYGFIESEDRLREIARVDCGL